MPVPSARLKSLAILGVAAALTWAAAAPAQAPTPSVRLVGPVGTVELPRFGSRVPLDVGTWVAATGGDFELRVARPDYDSPVDIVQVDSVTRAVLRDLPDDVLNGWRGLKGFVRVIVTDPAGARAASKRFTFCPGGFERQRVDDSGPEEPRYPQSCGSFSPFTKGMVWGIDGGWATPALGGGEFGSATLRLAPGRYTFTVRINSRYVGLLEIPAEDAEVTFPVRVRRGGGFLARRAETVAAGGARSADVPDVADPDPETLPDLVALPPWSLQAFSRRGRDFLAFAATPWNAGPAPLVVEGFRRPGEEVMDAYQYFRDAGGDVVGRAEVGDMRFHPHPAHDHWHFLQFASFTLHDAADLELVRSRKQAFCLAPTDPIDTTVERAEWSPWGGLGTSCGGRSALWVREVLQAGWGDTYFQSVPGQSWDVTTLANGWYYARIAVNPLGTLHETDMSNNVESRLVLLGGRPGARWAAAAPWHGIEE